jgi:arabinose-5-phosphate isomerase
LNKELIFETAQETIAIEARSIDKLQSFIDDDFLASVKTIHESKGRVVISGIGKSAIIAQKIVATLNSTGTPSIFLHAADAIHGDLGMLQQDDVAMIISKSGESEEIKVLTPLIKNFGNTLIALCGNVHSFLATHADYVINSTVDAEACPNNLAPTSSTTAQLVMGDALAVCLLKLKGFAPKDFAKYHPGGALGKRLYLLVHDLSSKNEMPKVFTHTNLKDTIVEITSKRLGTTAVLNEDGTLAGIITDGDIRRMLEKDFDIKASTAKDIMNATPKIIQQSELAVYALDVLRTNNISQLIVLDNQQYTGVLHIHDIIREGIL